MDNPKPNFFERTRGAQKVLVLDLGFLGDTVHLLPALWVVRQAYPKAELHVIVGAHVTSLIECVPWVNGNWGYSRFPKHATLGENLETVRRLRKQRYDVVINLNGSDRSSWLTLLSGARERLGRVPQDGGPPLWRRLFTEVVAHPFSDEPAYLQKCHCLRKVGFPGDQAEFHVQISSKHLQGARLTPADVRTFFHLSPFTTDDDKELRVEKMAELIDAVQEGFPDKKLAISCAPNERERRKMDSLMSKVRRRPWRLHAGDLSLVELAALIGQSALHLSGDTGTLHLALMTGVATVAWFRTAQGMKAWIPEGPRHRTLLGNGPGPDSFRGISVADALEAIKNVTAYVSKG